jgi:hypothetical protein
MPPRTQRFRCAAVRAPRVVVSVLALMLTVSACATPWGQETQERVKAPEGAWKLNLELGMGKGDQYQPVRRKTLAICVGEEGLSVVDVDPTLEKCVIHDAWAEEGALRWRSTCRDLENTSKGLGEFVVTGDQAKGEFIANVTIRGSPRYHRRTYSARRVGECADLEKVGWVKTENPIKSGPKQRPRELKR